MVRKSAACTLNVGRFYNPLPLQATWCGAAPSVADLPPRRSNGMGTVYGEGAGCGLRNAHIKIVELFLQKNKQKNFKYAMITSEENLGSHLEAKKHPMQCYALECLYPKPLTSKQAESMKKKIWVWNQLLFKVWQHIKRNAKAPNYNWVKTWQRLSCERCQASEEVVQILSCNETT